MMSIFQLYTASGPIWPIDVTFNCQRPIWPIDVFFNCQRADWADLLPPLTAKGNVPVSSPYNFFHQLNGE
jgi:hypothetical protein